MTTEIFDHNLAIKGNSLNIISHLCNMKTMQHFQELFENYLNEQKFNPSPKELYEPVQYILSLGGKRIRPALVLLANKAFQGNVIDALPAAFVMELFHNFTLVHDDIMDKASLRRGQPTVHKKYGDNAAILSGDVMMIWCYKYLMNLPQEKFKEVFELFNDTAIKVCEGQQMDMSFENRSNVSEAEYLKMIEYKTSVLLACSLKSGAMIAGATAHDADKIFEFGLNIGLAFQLQDDILDAFGEADKVGKEQGGDIKNNKKTLLLIKALSAAKGEDATQLQMLLSSNGEEKVPAMIQLFKKLGVKEYAESMAAMYNEKAFNALDAIANIDAEGKQGLIRFAEMLLNREQ
jgi:geranylgeranyl diphosphate synthase type II